MRIHWTTAAGVFAAVAACAGACAQPAGEPIRPAAEPPAPVDVRPPNAPFKPAFENQTRAPGVRTRQAYRTELVASGLVRPWAIAFLPDGRMLVTEKPGRLRVAARDGTLSDPATGLPEVDPRGQGGLLDVVLDPDFAGNQTIYWTYSERQGDTNGTAVAKGRLTADARSPRVENVQVIFRMAPKLTGSNLHYGSRLAFAPDGTLFATMGERSILPGRAQAQKMDSHLGKTVRINKDGSVPRDNPFVGKAGVLPEIWSSGHRNQQSAAIHPVTGKLWTTEHGPRGGDEVNVTEKGKDYGWPTITYSIEYAGPQIGEGIAQRAGLEQPNYYWDPIIAPSGMAFYTGDLFPEWKGNLFVGGLGSRHVARLVLDGERVVGEERILVDLGKRIRDVRQGPDGALYFATDEEAGEIVRVVPR